MDGHPANGLSMRILFVASEGLPFSKTGGLADVVEALPKALVVQGHEVAVGVARDRGAKGTAGGVPGRTVTEGRAPPRVSAVADRSPPNCLGDLLGAYPPY